MHRPDRFAHALHQTATIRERAIDFGERRCGKYHVRESGQLCFKQFLLNNKVKIVQPSCSIQMHRQQASGQVHCPNRFAFGVQQFIDVFAAGKHVMRADAVVKERQRMQQNAIPFTAEKVRELRDYRLSFSADFGTEHDDDIALCFRDGAPRY